jgi:hypothetical protein
MEQNTIAEELIAICGMNCHLCSAYNRAKNGCLGCRAEVGLRCKHSETCKIRNCEMAVSGNFRFCFECESFPCKKIKHIDKRYTTKYAMSMIENLELIRRSGLREFLVTQVNRWTCPRCGKILSVHKPFCLNCNYAWR